MCHILRLPLSLFYDGANWLSVLLISEQIPITAGAEAFTIADFGAYDGAVSMPLIRDCIGNVTII